MNPEQIAALEYWPTTRGAAEMARALLARRAEGPPQFNFQLPAGIEAPLNIGPIDVAPSSIRPDLAQRIRRGRGL